MNTVVISDIHIGANRSGGTTPASALELRRYILFNFQQLLEQANGCNLLINGDLFDASHIPLVDMYATQTILADWLQRNPESSLCLPPGNHDLSKNTDVFSAFDYLANHLRTRYPTQVVIPRSGEMCLPSILGYVVPHMANQDLFDRELMLVPQCDFLFLHCNYDNKFAAQSDHSLNLSPETAAKLPARHIIIGHEHQAKSALEGKVRVAGNQIPSSVMDCLGNESKWMLKLARGAVMREPPVIERIQTWEAEGSFTTIDWRAIGDNDAAWLPDFVRVEGEATAGEAAAVVAAISKVRQRAQSFVITNAVKIEGMSSDEQMQLSLEQVQSFDIMSALLDFLDDDMRAAVRRLMEGRRA